MHNNTAFVLLCFSVAIMRYIAVKFNIAEHWYPRADAQSQARVDEFLNWQHLGVRKPCIDVFLNVVSLSVWTHHLRHFCWKKNTHQETVIRREYLYYTFINKFHLRCNKMWSVKNLMNCWQQYLSRFRAVWYLLTVWDYTTQHVGFNHYFTNNISALYRI